MQDTAETVGKGMPEADAIGKRREKLTAVGALFGAVLSSSCCLVPLLLISLGVGGSWIGTLTSLAPYQPFFLIPTLAILAYGFWHVYGRSSAACGEGDACARPLPRRFMEFALWLATLLVVAAILLPRLALFLI